MITNTEFFLFTALVLAIGWGFHWKFEAKKSHRLLLEIFQNDAFRDSIIKDYQLFKKSIMKEV